MYYKQAFCIQSFSVKKDEKLCTSSWGKVECLSYVSYREDHHLSLCRRWRFLSLLWYLRHWLYLIPQRLLLFNSRKSKWSCKRESHWEPWCQYVQLRRRTCGARGPRTGYPTVGSTIRCRIRHDLYWTIIQEANSIHILLTLNIWGPNELDRMLFF